MANLNHAPPESSHLSPRATTDSGSDYVDAEAISPKAGCCVDCGSGRTHCDYVCIRKLAAIECQSACGNQELQQPPVGLGDRFDDCCVPSQVSACAGDRPEPSEGELDPIRKSAATGKDNCCAGKDGKSISAGKKEGCCAKKKEVQLNLCKKDTCCTSKDTSVAETKEEATCCSLNKGTTLNLEKKVCCSSTTACNDAMEEEDNCCTDTDTSCVDVNEDENGSSSNADTNSHINNKSACCSAKADKTRPENLPARSESCTSSFRGTKRLQTGTEACNSHLQDALDKYTRYLEQGLCICRSVLNRLDQCCGKPISPATKDEPTSYAKSSAVPTARQGIHRRSAKGACRDVYYDQKTQTIKSTQRRNSSDCSVSHLAVKTMPQQKEPVARAKNHDIEIEAAREHVVLGVSGMTCTGCSRKVTNVLQNVEGVSSVKVTFVTGIAEFDLDSSLASAEQIIPRIEKETGFKYSRIVSTYQVLDVRIDPAKAKDACAELGKLVESVEKIDKTTYRVSYNPASIGARTIFESVAGISLAPPGIDVTLADGKRRLVIMGWSTILAALLTIPIVVLAWSNTPTAHSTKSVVSLVLATLVQAIAVPEFYVGAIKSLVYSRVLEMDMLVVISVTAAYGYSVIAFALTHAGYALETGEFFETSSLLITLVLLGRFVAATAKVRAVSAVSLRSLQAEKALLVTSSGDTTEIDARLLQFGDTFLVRPHARIVTDGEVVYGQSAVDESMLTGESVPVSKSPGDGVIAGTLNGSTALSVRITRLPGKNSITDIANLVENALASKPHIQDLADKVASYFIPFVITLALVAFGIWLGVAIKLRGKNGGGAIGVAITYGIAVLAVSCPCALGLAVPMVLVIAGGVAAKAGVIIRQADALERGYKVTDVVFDKTGTLTKGDLTVVHSEVFPCPVSPGEVLSLVKALMKDNQHPVSSAVAAHNDVRLAGAIDVDNVVSNPGAGVQCTWRGSVVKAGNPYWLEIDNRPQVAKLIEQGMTLLCVTLDSVPVAAFGLKSTIREEAGSVIDTLHRYNIKCHIVSGDGPRVVEDVAQAIGIPVSNLVSRHNPKDKQEYVKALMSKDRVVLFCGDGTNDAAAVAQANVGVQFGTTSDVTRATADVVLLGGLEGVLMLLKLSKRSFRRIMFNFVWSAIYNLFAILLAGGAFVKTRIPPAYAGLGEIVSVLPVIIVALSLARKQYNK
ncbi:copper-translocating P-type ATPase [Fonsecaea erecta]|uniref:Copper-translocating P-type ATPase n=1 Tax=Fonsecaea erecta TaxID=1367422 RepID=A0A178ZM73_9EURO|nr:copper-translocating P-type ATPase [Fonsecaea erecta]OAP60877.1 copper-translocating P-type ATPase [Fonsecaea erecta]